MEKSKWLYKGEIIDELPDWVFGFIYKIYYEDGTRYIGKKTRFSYIKKPLGKKELALVTDKRLKKYKVVEKESDWRTYEGSSKLTKDKTISYKEILRFCKTARDLTYWEMYYLFCEHTLFDDKYMNQNINRMFFPGTDLTNSKKYIKEE